MSPECYFPTPETIESRKLRSRFYSPCFDAVRAYIISRAYLHLVPREGCTLDYKGGSDKLNQ